MKVQEIVFSTSAFTAGLVIEAAVEKATGTPLAFVKAEARITRSCAVDTSPEPETVCNAVTDFSTMNAEI